VSTPLSLRLPAGASTATLATPRGDFAALQVGDPADTPLLLLPGFTGSKEDFLALLAPLADAGFAVTAIDLRGQYQTPGGPGADYSLAGFAADVAAVAASIAGTGPVHLLGHSFGGLVAQQVVADHPEVVASLTLLCSGPGALPDEQGALLRQLAGLLPAVGMEQAWRLKSDADRARGWQPPTDPDVAAFLHDRFVGNDPAGLAGIALLLADCPDLPVPLDGPPTLVAYGARDDAWPLQRQQAMARARGADLVVIPDAGHSPGVDAPEATAAVVSAFVAGGVADSGDGDLAGTG